MRHRPFHVLHGARQSVGEFIAADLDFVMVETVAVDHHLAELAFVVGMVAEAHRIGCDTPAGRLAGHRGDQT